MSNKRFEWETQPFFKKFKWTITFFSLFLLAIAIVVSAVDNYSTAILPKYAYIWDAKNFINKAQIALTPEEKTACLGKAIQIYGNGPNLKNLESLNAFNTTNDFGNVSELLWNEVHSYTWDPYIPGAIFGVFFLGCSVVGVATCPDIWYSNRRRYFLLILTLIFLTLFLIKFVI
jgi:hypothetical protein